MIKVDSYEARTRLPALLERVARGERIVITKRGRPVAQLIPVEKEKIKVEETIEAISSRVGLKKRAATGGQRSDPP